MSNDSTTLEGRREAGRSPAPELEKYQHKVSYGATIQDRKDAKDGRAERRAAREEKAKSEVKSPTPLRDKLEAETNVALGAGIGGEVAAESAKPGGKSDKEIAEWNKDLVEAQADLDKERAKGPSAEERRELERETQRETQRETRSVEKETTPKR